MKTNYTEEQLTEMISILKDSEQELADDVKELWHYEKRLRETHRHLEAYCKIWLSQLRRMAREIEIVENKRIALEQELILREKEGRQKERQTKTVMTQVEKMNVDQLKAMLEQINKSTQVQ